MFRQPLIFQSFPEIIAAESTRYGGISPAPYASLNLGKHTGDAPENVSENRRRFCSALGFSPEQLAWSKQVHGAEVRFVAEPGGAEGYDALITNVPGIFLAVSVADCTPILIYDPENRAAAAIHAGWRGAAANIIGRTLDEMRQHFGTTGSSCFAYIGACIDACSFEVGPEVAAQFDETFTRFDPERNKFFVDLKNVCAAQLAARGFAEMHIEISPYSTVLHNADYFSHRLEHGVTGRMMAVIGLKAYEKAP